MDGVKEVFSSICVWATVILVIAKNVFLHFAPLCKNKKMANESKKDTSNKRRLQTSTVNYIRVFSHVTVSVVKNGHIHVVNIFYYSLKNDASV